MTKTVAVVGMGITGIQATKACLQPGLDIKPTCFERHENVGGFWWYRPDKNLHTIYKSIHIDSPRDINSFGDRPYKGTDPVICSNEVVLKYVRDNFKEFNLGQYTRLNTTVDWIEPTDEGPGKKAKYRVTSTTKSADGSATKRTETFDGVMICVGRHSKSWIPEIEGLDSFKGTKFHTGNYKSPEINGMVNKRICVVGSGNSGVDISTELGACNEQVYMVSRHGIWCVDVGGRAGMVTDQRSDIAGTVFGAITRLTIAKGKNVPWKEASQAIEDEFPRSNLLKKHGLYPDHHFSSAHPSITGVKDADNTLYTELEKGHIIAKKGINRITENGVVFTDSDEVVPVDVIVLATGFRYAIDFLDPRVVDLRYERDGANSRVPLYQYMVPINDKELKYTNLGVLNFVQSATFPMADIQTYWWIRQFNGEISLPSQPEMARREREFYEELMSRYYKSERHHSQGGLVVPYYDNLAKDLRAFPWPDVLLRENPEAMWAAWFTPFHASQWRLIGPGKCDQAIEWIKECYEDVLGHPAPANYRDGEYWYKKILEDEELDYDLSEDSPLKRRSRM